MEAVVGFLIRRERLRREWSQAGLCRGICAVSYLSKIEQGKVSASEEVLRRLAQRLELPWYGGTAALAEAGAQIERLYEALLYLNQPALEREKPLFAADMERLAFSPYAVDAALLKRALFDDAAALPETEMEPYMDARQLALLRIFQGRFDEAIRLYPHAYCHFCAGADAYASGESYAVALAHLQRGYDLAARDGAAWLMLQCRLLMGNCFCNQLELEHMQAEYGAAARLATALRDTSSLRHIAYNTASAQLEAGQYEEAYAYFSRLEQPTAMELHKLAICCADRLLPPSTLPGTCWTGQRRGRWPRRFARWCASGWSIRTICSGRNMGGCCWTALMRAAKTCPSATPAFICPGWWNGTRPTASTSRHLSF